MASSSEALPLEQYYLAPEVSRFEKYRRNLFRFIRHKPLGAFGGLIVILLLFMAIAPSVFATHEANPTPPPIIDRLQGPSGEHWMGTDQQGRDEERHQHPDDPHHELEHARHPTEFRLT